MNSPQKVFITGISSGIGLELARRYAAEQAMIGGCAMDTPAQAAHCLPATTHYFQTDVTDKTALGQAIKNYATVVGGLDILIACAGISMPKSSWPDFEQGQQVIEVNLQGTLNSFAPAIELMRAQGHGQLVALGSFAGLVGLPGMAFYGASKAALMHFCESLAIDLHAHGITVTTVAPGFVATPLTRNNPHRMPFLMSAPLAARKIHHAIRRKRSRVVIPWPMAWLGGLLYHLPRSLYLKLMRLDPLGLKAGQHEAP